MTDRPRADDSRNRSEGEAIDQRPSARPAIKDRKQGLANEEKLKGLVPMSRRAWQIGLLAFCLLQATANAQSRGEMAAGGGTNGGGGAAGYRYRSPPAPRYGSGQDTNGGSGGFVTTLGGGSATSTRGINMGSSGSGGFVSTTVGSRESTSSEGSTLGGTTRGVGTTTSSSSGSGLGSTSTDRGSSGTFTSASGGQATSSGTFSAPGTAGVTSTTTGGKTSSSSQGTFTSVTRGTATGSSPATGRADTASPSPDTTSTPTTPGGTTTTVSGGTATAAQCGVGGNPACAGGNSDPVMYGFAGRSFNFMGEVGKIYNIISTQTLQVSMKLKLAQMWDHNGTNMEAIGFMYRTYKVLVALDENQDITVSLQGKVLKEKKVPQHHAWRFENGAYIETVWDKYKPGLGNTVIVTTDVLKMTIWQTPAGIVDEGGVVLPSWLNFGITLLGPPANGIMHGIVGGTYDRYLEGESAVSKPESQLYLPPDDSFHGKFQQEEYEMKDYWDTNFPANLFGVNSPEIKERSSLEDDTTEAAFPAFAHACFLCNETPSGQSHTF
ncbi:g5808 [Coccomyxa elongata]